MFKTIDEALDYIMNQRRTTNEFSKFLNLVQKLHYDEPNYHIIHVAGTNGKGSCVSYIASTLNELGYKVGTLQSPHLITHLDRIRINGINIKEEAFLRILNKNLALYQKYNLNMFEMDYLIMCEYFKEEAVDFAIIEVGIGGRLDSTNVIKKPLLSIIVTIGYDHMEMLGDTLEKITYEKCGIIKDNSAVLVGDLNDDLKAIVKKEAKRHHSKYLQIDKFQYLKERTFKYRDLVYELFSYAKYQMHNASLAIEALLYLDSINIIKYDYLKVKKAIKNTLWRGRFEIIAEKPLVILDGAHNIDGVKALIESLRDIKLSKAILFSAIESKEYLKMIELLNKECDKLILTKFKSFKKIYDTNLVNKELNIDVIDDFREAYHYLYDNYECIIVCGSLYFISAFIEGISYE